MLKYTKNVASQILKKAIRPNTRTSMTVFMKNDIFFTDEKRFILNTLLNHQTHQIRIDDGDKEDFKSGKGELYEKS